MSQHLVKMNRRLFLKGAGTLIALPCFASLGRGESLDRTTLTRFCFLYVPNGMSMEHWRPRQVGPLGTGRLPPTLLPLANHLEYITVASGLDNRASERAGRPETLGEHARSIGAFLSAVYPAQNLRAAETIDVTLARSLRGGVRIPLLNLATEYAEDQHDVGFSEVFNYSLSWKDDRTPIQPIESPRYAFELLCGAAKTPGEIQASIEDRRYSKKSVLDAILEASKTLQGKLNPGDRRGLDEYLQSIRTVEQGISAAAADTPTACGDHAARFDEPRSYEEHLTIMLDLLYLALRSNSSQVATLLFGAEKTERDFGFLTDRVGFDMSGGHHSTSHHKNKASQIRKYVQINTFHAQHLARFL